MADNHTATSPSFEAGGRDHDSNGGSSSQMKRNRWGKTPYPIPTATMSLDEEQSLQASKRSDTPSSILSPTGQIPLGSGEAKYGKSFGETVRGIREMNLQEKLFRLKSMKGLQDTEENQDDSEFKKVLGTRDLVSLGIGSCVGTGMYLVAGMVAKTKAGPAVVLSYAIAGIAALLSGLCYAELGARVPHTTGSAYVYSYVTVGEFVAFIIGWNMILEYIIGTASCACALSACIDIISNGAVSNITTAWAGEVWNAPPDVLAMGITCVMMLIFFEGVKRSVLFNNVLNIINLASWIIIVGIGSWFIKKENWDNFMPFGFSGVLKGASTCFYAFIGFDIIATTGEEAKNPRKSMPIAIIVTLIIVMLAYISCSAILTLMVNYESLNEKAALVQVWGKIGYPSIEWLVSIGAIAALTASMFGSMFPMPRIAYAMAKDGLIFKMFSRVNSRGVPHLANLILGLISAVCALVFTLEVLVEMMSIGTLLAYTLVDACVLILRYQPPPNFHGSVYGSTNNGPALVENILDERTKTETNNKSNEGSAENKKDENDYSSGCFWKTVYGLIHIFDPLIRLIRGTHEMQIKQKKMFSENTFANYMNSEFSAEEIDRQNTMFGENNLSKSISRQHTTEEIDDYSKFIGKIFTSLAICIVILDAILVILEDHFTPETAVLVVFLGALVLTGHLLAIANFSQTKPRGFQTPAVPVIPALGILINIYLMFKLSSLTIIRFTVWMVLGFITYFKYGIWESSLHPKSTSSIDGVD